MPTVLSALRCLHPSGSTGSAPRPAARALVRMASLSILCAAAQVAAAAAAQPGPRGSSFTVGGTVGGMVGTDLVLSLDGGDNLLVGSNGPFTFSQPLAMGSSYDVTIAQQPIDPTQVCTVINGSGTIATSNITNVQVDCGAPQGHLVLSVSDDHAYARYGMTMSYVVTLTNDGTGDAAGVSISNVSPPQIDASLTTWTCVGAGEGATCTTSGSGALADSGIALPVGRSLAWLVTAPMRADATGDVLDYTVDASGAGTASATDSDVLVLLRTGVDVPYGDGAEGAPPPGP
jgi:uncharacterized repeat protein (TIGR01451 family)